MAGVKISALPALPSAALTDLIAEVQPAVGGTTYKATLQQLSTLFATSLVTPQNGGIVYTDANSLEVLAPTATANQVLMSGANSAPHWSTPTYPTASGTAGKLIRSDGTNNVYTTLTFPDTAAQNVILFANVANNIGPIAPVNSALLISSGAGVPSWSNSAIPAHTMAGAINMGAFQINNMADPTLNQDAATKLYVDTVAQGLNVHESCRVATTAALTVTYNNVSVPPSGVGATLTNAAAMAALSIDGVALSVGNRVLVKDQAAQLQNGAYSVTDIGSGATNWIMTRTTDYDVPAEIQPGDLFVINEGSVNANRGYIEDSTVTSVGVDSITFSQFGGGGTVTSVATGGLATGGPITTTGTVTVTAASSADQDTGTSNTVVVTPGVQRFHPSACDGWAYIITGVGPSFSQEFNCSGVVRDNTGKYTVSWDNDFNAGYAAVTTCMNGGDVAYTSIVDDLAVGSIQIQLWTVDAVPALTDGPPQVAIVAFGPAS